MREEKRNFMILKRKRIEEELEKIFSTGLFIVTGKSGYGKTTEVLGFLRRESMVDTIYVSLMFSGDDDRWMWKKICTAIKAVNEPLGNEMDSFGIPKNNFDIDNIIESLCKNIKSETVIVCDDCDNVENRMIKRLIERIAFEKIQYFHVVLITRNALANKYTYYEFKDKCIVLEQEIFTFNKNEIIELFHVNGLKINDDEINQVYEYTFGWPLPVYLLAEGYDSNKQMFYNLSKCFKLIKSLLYKRIAEKDKNILLRLCLLDEFSIKQAVYITEESAERIIKTLEYENLCIYYDTDFHTYKFNTLFKTMLKEELKKSSIDEGEVYDKWIKWCIQNKDYIKILEKIILLEDYKIEDIKNKNITFNSFKNIFSGMKLKQYNSSYEDFELLSLNNSILCRLHKKYGQMQSILKKAEKSIIDFIEFTDGCGYGLEYLINGEYLYLTGNLKEAEKYILKALEKAESRNQHSIYVCAYFILMKILWNSTDRNTLYIKINKLGEYAENYNIKKVKLNIDLAGGYIYGLLGKNDKVADWIKNYSRNLYNLDRNAIEEVFNVSGILLLIEERYSDLKVLCDVMVEKYIKGSNIIGLVYAHIYNAAALYKLNEIDNATESFLNAVNIAEKDNIIMPFVELSTFINDLIGITDKSTDFMKEIIKNMPVCRDVYFETVCEKNIIKNHSIFELTERESEIMELVCTGETQNNIAENLHVSVNTVRYHLKNVYEKLEVNNKTLAIQKYKIIGAGV